MMFALVIGEDDMRMLNGWTPLRDRSTRLTVPSRSPAGASENAVVHNQNRAPMMAGDKLGQTNGK